jgi:hypothetical protein
MFEFGLAGHVVDARGEGFLQVVVTKRDVIGSFGELFVFVGRQGKLLCGKDV